MVESKRQNCPPPPPTLFNYQPSQITDVLSIFINFAKPIYLLYLLVYLLSRNVIAIIHFSQE